MKNTSMSTIFLLSFCTPFPASSYFGSSVSPIFNETSLFRGNSCKKKAKITCSDIMCEVGEIALCTICVAFVLVL